jgi:hypothetical protein
MSALLKPSPAPPARLARVHVSFPMTLSGRLRLLAAARREHTEAMIAALIDYVVAHDLADDILDAMRGALRPGQGRIEAGGETLTHNQAAILFLVGENTGADGVCRLSLDKLSLLSGRGHSAVGNAVAALVRFSMIERDPSPVPGRLRPCRLTASGYAAWHDLARGE